MPFRERHLQKFARAAIVPPLLDTHVKYIPGAISSVRFRQTPPVPRVRAGMPPAYESPDFQALFTDLQLLSSYPFPSLPPA